jgi:3-methylcrotonyl-CoA carboxylase alpha subunit
MHSAWDARDLWRMNLPAALSVELEHDGNDYAIAVSRADDSWVFTLDGESYRLRGAWVDDFNLWLDLNDERIECPVLREAAALTLNYRGQAYRFDIPDRTHAGDSDATDADHPQAPMSGAVVALPVAVGDTVEPGDTLIVIEAMKMEHAIVAQVSGSVSEILFAVGDQVDEGDTLVLLEVE